MKEFLNNILDELGIPNSAMRITVAIYLLTIIMFTTISVLDLPVQIPVKVDAYTVKATGFRHVLIGKVLTPRYSLTVVGDKGYEIEIDVLESTFSKARINKKITIDTNAFTNSYRYDYNLMSKVMAVILWFSLLWLVVSYIKKYVLKGRLWRPMK
jgi:hypothetical protein